MRQGPYGREPFRQDYANAITRGIDRAALQINEGISITTRGTQAEPRRPRAGTGAESGYRGVVFVAGYRREGLLPTATKKWCRCVHKNASATMVAGPPPDPFPDGEIWFYIPAARQDLYAFCG